MTIVTDKIVINNIEYVRADLAAQPKPSGNRAVVVVDRGWIFAGDIDRKHGRIYLSRVVWVFSWESIGFNGVIADPKDKKANLKSIADLDLPEASEIFCVPVDADWGL
ncbi:MAG: hypothetical protein EBR82_12125 [Caulobacteraceae bacterium]|nr:hypothetical protein [Caulobacteraceae bacterium]